MPEDEIELGDRHDDLMVGLANSLPLCMADLLFLEESRCVVSFLEIDKTGRSALFILNHRPQGMADKVVYMEVQRYLFNQGGVSRIIWVHGGRVLKTQIEILNGVPICTFVPNLFKAV